jgi:hypothetical protein
MPNDQPAAGRVAGVHRAGKFRSGQRHMQKPKGGQGKINGPGIVLTVKMGQSTVVKIKLPERQGEMAPLVVIVLDKMDVRVVKENPGPF